MERQPTASTRAAHNAVDRSTCSSCPSSRNTQREKLAAETALRCEGPTFSRWKYAWSIDQRFFWRKGVVTLGSPRLCGAPKLDVSGAVTGLRSGVAAAFGQRAILDTPLHGATLGSEHASARRCQLRLSASSFG